MTDIEEKLLSTADDLIARFGSVDEYENCLTDCKEQIGVYFSEHPDHSHNQMLASFFLFMQKNCTPDEEADWQATAMMFNIAAIQLKYGL
jgi:hypothetical protein